MLLALLIVIALAIGALLWRVVRLERAIATLASLPLVQFPDPDREKLKDFSTKLEIIAQSKGGLDRLRERLVARGLATRGGGS